MRVAQKAALALGVVALGGAGWTLARRATLQLGKQPDGRFIVSSGQRIEAGTIAFDGRPTDLALHPTEELAAVLGEDRVFLTTKSGVVAGTDVPLGDGASGHGILWSADGKKLFASVSNGEILEMRYEGEKLARVRTLSPKPTDAKGNPRPSGLALTRDGKTLFAACIDRNAVAEIDLGTGKFVREFKTENLPFDVKLSTDETVLLASNWGGKLADKDDQSEETIEAAGAVLVTDPRGVTTTGSVTRIERATGKTLHTPVPPHPTALLVQGDRAFVACAAADVIAELDASTGKLLRTIPIRFESLKLFGAQPNALALSGDTLFVACGGDNAIAEVDLKSGKVQGFRPVGYYPTAVAFSPPSERGPGGFLWALNTKGNGSVKNTVRGKPGNAHDFQGTVSVLNRKDDLKIATERVATLNGWKRDRSALNPKKKVFAGAIQHVLYIIKENRTYDEVFGDLPEGNGDPKLCGLGEEVTPNHHALARTFTLFDNGYVSGTNSADGHHWTDGAIANDYLEHMYTGYRTYPDDGEDPMGQNSSGYIWDLAQKNKKSVRIYGEFCEDSRAIYSPQPKDWLEMWKDRGIGRIKTQVRPLIPSVAKLAHPNYMYWPLFQSDQARADIFIEEYNKFSKTNRVPNLMILSLPCDHTEGLNPQFPKPKSMVADNDLALGRIVEAVSKSKEWKNTAIFVIEDDAQAGPDHIDGHRTVFACYSPYVKRKFVDSNLYTTVSMVRTIEKMLNLPPMNKMDALTPPMSECFTETPDLSGFTSVPNRVKLDDMNPARAALSPEKQKWFDLSASLDWSRMDGADFAKLNQVLWHELHDAR
jgi:DNA-binding beta-propeller fold protein YncE